MKEIIISKARCKIELITLLACCIIACLFNLGAIIIYKSPAIELITALGYVLIFGIALYVLWSLIRLAVYVIKKTFIKK
jgi:hypothetical protein